MRSYSPTRAFTAPAMSPGRAWFRAAAVSSRRISTTPSATPSLDSKWLSTVWWETPAAAAMAASVTSSNG